MTQMTVVTHLPNYNPRHGENRMGQPAYLNRMVVLPSRQLSEDERQAPRYLLNRLGGALNVYHWALAWTLHKSSDWTLGEPPCPFVLNQQSLWVLGIETVRHLASLGWESIVETASVRPEKSGDTVVGSIRLSDIEWDDEKQTVFAQAISWTSPSGEDEKGPPIFRGHDLVLSVRFHDDLDCVPWVTLAGSLHRAFVNAEPYLRPVQANWPGPPFFRHFEHGHELLDDIRQRQENANDVLADLEQHRRKRLAEIGACRRAADSKKGQPAKGIANADPTDGNDASASSPSVKTTDNTPKPARKGKSAGGRPRKWDKLVQKAIALFLEKPDVKEVTICRRYHQGRGSEECPTPSALAGAIKGRLGLTFLVVRKKIKSASPDRRGKLKKAIGSSRVDWTVVKDLLEPDSGQTPDASE